MSDTKNARLRVVTANPKPPPNIVEITDDYNPCDHTMTCPCLKCEDDRAQRVTAGVRKRRNDQTWIPRPSRRAA